LHCALFICGPIPATRKRNASAWKSERRWNSEGIQVEDRTGELLQPGPLVLGMRVDCAQDEREFAEVLGITLIKNTRISSAGPHRVKRISLSHG